MCGVGLLCCFAVIATNPNKKMTQRTPLTLGTELNKTN
jgi:hypothetical protein